MALAGAVAPVGPALNLTPSSQTGLSHSQMLAAVTHSPRKPVAKVGVSLQRLHSQIHPSLLYVAQPGSRTAYSGHAIQSADIRQLCE